MRTYRFYNIKIAPILKHLAMKSYRRIGNKAATGQILSPMSTLIYMQAQ